MNKIIHKTVVGSRLHNLHNDNSDFDYRGIFVVPFVEIISPFKKPQNTSWIEGKDDDTSFELCNFSKMLTSGNPTCLEVLWSNMIVETSDIGYKLVKNRQKFLDDERIYQSHVGYSFNQLKKMDLYNPDMKRTPKTIIAYIRSLRQGAELLISGDFNPVYEYPDREFLLEVKYNYNNSLVGDISKLMLAVREEIEIAHNSLKTKRNPDIPWIEDFLLTTYKSQ